MHTFTDNNVITLNIRHGLDYPEHEMIIYCEVGNYSVSENILNYLKNYDCLEDSISVKINDTCTSNNTAYTIILNLGLFSKE